MIFENAKYIIHPQNNLYEPVHFHKDISVTGEIKKATLNITSLGCYYAEINGKRVGDFILAPGFTSRKRVQYQSYDVKDMLNGQSELDVTVSDGWYKGKINFAVDNDGIERKKALLLELEIEYENGETVRISSDENWLVKKDKLRYAELYDGEVVDMLFEDEYVNARAIRIPHEVILYSQEGEIVKEQETIYPIKIFKTPNGDTLVDFGQNLTGYFEFNVNAHKGDKVEFTVCEVLDKNGNFYNENYRDAKARFEYICKEGYNCYKPILAFWGFRYIRVDSFPCEITKENIKAIVVHSDIKRTGYLESSDEMLNRLISNVIWGQKGNFLDVPTDCPQRDERQGWTGDATVFCKTATYNFDSEKFFKKWLTDLRLDQGEKGNIPNIIPQTICWDWSTTENCGAVWGDSCTIIPYQVYKTYGCVDVIEKQFPTMLKYLEYIKNHSADEYLWTGCVQFGDWLALDNEVGNYRGASDDDFIASVFYANSTKIVGECAKLLGKDYAEYEEQYKKIVEKIRGRWSEYKTQTECALALYFDIATDKKAVADKLAYLIIDNGRKLNTGFVGTPFLLHALSQNGYSELAYDLLLQEEFPSWLYSVRMGATTIWEHWDGKDENGDMWSKDMNSFNHYAYGSVADWMYEVALGITPQKPGFEEVRIAPVPTDRIERMSAILDTRHGRIVSKWRHFEHKIRYEITTPVKATIVIDGKEFTVENGSYIF